MADWQIGMFEGEQTICKTPSLLMNLLFKLVDSNYAFKEGELDIDQDENFYQALSAVFFEPYTSGLEFFSTLVLRPFNETLHNIFELVILLEGTMKNILEGLGSLILGHPERAGAAFIDAGKTLLTAVFSAIATVLSPLTTIVLALTKLGASYTAEDYDLEELEHHPYGLESDDNVLVLKI